MSAPNPPASNPSAPNHLDVARRVLALEAAGLAALSDALDAGFAAVVEALAELPGRVVLAGVGKSGHVARKIAATLSSTGTPALFLHPTEASHGDMGMIAPGDAVVALSRSGETGELADLVAYCRRHAVPLVAVTAGRASTLARASDHLLALPDAPEACATTRAPTTSTLMQMALGDALAVALLEARGFTAEDFHDRHPGGRLGARLLKVGDLMHAELPLVAPATPLGDALEVMSAHGFGCVGVVGAHGRLDGLFTDGDLRRALGSADLATPVSAVMTRDPVTFTSQTHAADALARMQGRIMQAFVVDQNRPTGLVHLHDLLRAGVV